VGIAGTGGERGRPESGSTGLVEEMDLKATPKQLAAAVMDHRSLLFY
jgi:hypothetical protein